MQTFMCIEGILFTAEEAGAAMREGELEGNDGAGAFAGFDADLAAVVAHDALDNHHAESVAVFFRGVVGLEDFGEVGFGNAGTGVDELEGEEFVVEGGADAELPAGLHRFHGVFNDVEKDLLDLTAVAEDGGRGLVDFDIDLEFAVDEFGLLHAEDFFDELEEVDFVEFGFLGTDGFEEMGDDAVEAADFALADLEGIGDGIGGGGFGVGLEFIELALDELEVNGEGIEGVTEFVGDSGGEAHDGIDALALDAFLEGDFVLGDVGEDDDVAAAVGGADLRGNGHHVEAEVATFGVGELDFAGEDGFGGAGGIDGLRVD